MLSINTVVMLVQPTYRIHYDNTPDIINLSGFEIRIFCDNKGNTMFVDDQAPVTRVKPSYMGYKFWYTRSL